MVGGTGKTPFLIELASIYKYKKIYIISSGYGRKSKNLVEVMKNGKLISNSIESGDEAILIANKLRNLNINIIVTKNRIEGIKIAEDNFATLIILDDAFHCLHIKKIDILLFPNKIYNYLLIPSGPFREIYFTKFFANLSLIEDVDFKRNITIINKTERMILYTAISNPQRLDKFIKNMAIVKKIYLEDHSYFNRDKIVLNMIKYSATSILVTEKDFVKLDKFNINISILELNFNINQKIIKEIDILINNSLKPNTLK